MNLYPTKSKPKEEEKEKKRLSRHDSDNTEREIIYFILG